MSTCIFCNKTANSHEHIWPKWIQKKKDFGPIRSTRGSTDHVTRLNKLTVKAVCNTCNNGWMSELEGRSKPIVGCMFDDVVQTLDQEQQTTIATWAMKTAMITDATRSRSKSIRFYTQEECGKMREQLTIPPRTRIWIGRLDSQHIASRGSDFERLGGSNRIRISIDSVLTLAAGHFVAQIVTTHILPEFIAQRIPDGEPQGGDWSNELIQIWPMQKDWITWPPENSFTNGGPHGIAYLMHRWQIGEPADQILPSPPPVIDQ